LRTLSSIAFNGRRRLPAAPRTRRSTTASSVGAGRACSTASSYHVPRRTEAGADHDRRQAPHGGEPDAGRLRSMAGRRVAGHAGNPASRVRPPPLTKAGTQKNGAVLGATVPLPVPDRRQRLKLILNSSPADQFRYEPIHARRSVRAPVRVEVIW
jgi:hypothetical protein